MGYSYERVMDSRGRMRSRLACDACPGSDGVRRVRCPFGYCPAPALCGPCRVKHKDKLGRAWHREQGCEREHIAFAARENAKRAALAAGKMLRCSALGFFKPGPRQGWTHVLFQGISRETGREVIQGFVMAPGVYRAVPLDALATPETYMAIGTCVPGPDSFHAPGGASAEG